MLYIMVAHHYDKKLNSVADIMEEEGGQFDYTIVVGQREFGYKRYVPCFVISGGDMNLGLGHTQYTQDTGLGYKNKGNTFIVENTIYVKDGIISLKQNNIGLDDGRRSTWVFK
jgi:hypothetical protein